MPGGYGWHEDEWTVADAREVLRTPSRDDHKYSRGSVLMLTGSSAYPGAAVLSVEGAWRTGIGMVRWFGETDVGRLVLQQRPETVMGAGRTDAVVVGSGIDARTRTDQVTRAIERMPPMITGEASGSSTRKTTWCGRIPTALAAETVAASTDWTPA